MLKKEKAEPETIHIYKKSGQQQLSGLQSVGI